MEQSLNARIYKKRSSMYIAGLYKLHGTLSFSFYRENSIKTNGICMVDKSNEDLFYHM